MEISIVMDILPPESPFHRWTLPQAVAHPALHRQLLREFWYDELVPHVRAMEQNPGTYANAFTVQEQLDKLIEDPGMQERWNERVDLLCESLKARYLEPHTFEVKGTTLKPNRKVDISMRVFFDADGVETT